MNIITTEAYNCIIDTRKGATFKRPDGQWGGVELELFYEGFILG